VTESTDGRFVPGHQLSAALYHHIVEPALTANLLRLRYAAGLIGYGSDVLGYDSLTSTDHDWGPRVQLVVDEAELPTVTPQILDIVEAALPETIEGIPIELPGATQLPGGEMHHHNSPTGRRNHGVTVTSVEQLQHNLLGTTDQPHGWTPSQWLVVPRQSLLEFTAGPVHRDDIGNLTEVRTALAWYPHDVWLYVMSGRWQRIAQVEAFVGRAAEVGDDLGSRVVVAQIVLDAMQLALLQHHAYAPYAKWLGTAFKNHETDDSLTAPLAVASAADSASRRQEAIVAALLELSRRHDQLAVTEPLQSKAERFFTRPFPVIWCQRIAEALHGAITDPQVAALIFGLGGIDEITNSTDALKNTELRGQIMALYR
jgi:hypothetical protein